MPPSFEFAGSVNDFLLHGIGLIQTVFKGASTGYRKPGDFFSLVIKGQRMTTHGQCKV
jgi:hypothetical protein